MPIKKIKTPPNWFASVFQANPELFPDWTESELRAFASAFEILKIPSGKAVVDPRKNSLKLYFVIEGVCEEFSLRDSSSTREIGPGAYLGEASFFHWEEGVLGVRTKTDSIVAAIARQEWNRLEKKFPHRLGLLASRIISRRFFRLAIVRPSQKEILDFLSSLEILFHFDRNKVSKLQSHLEWLYVPGGERLIRQGDPGNSLYIIVSGRFRFVTEDGNGKRISEGEFGKGDIIGEMSLLTGEPRSASVYALRSGQVIRISRDGFRKFISRSPEGLFHITETIARRLNEKNRGGIKVGRKVHTIALVPLTKGFPLREFSKELSKSLKPFGSSLTVSKDKFEKFIQQQRSKKNRGENFGISEILSWFNGLEREYDKIFFEVEHEDSLWVEACLRQADRILILVEPGSLLEEGRHAWKVLQGGGLHETLRETVFYVEDGYSSWHVFEDLFKKLPGQRHIVRKNKAGEFDRVARRMEGKAVGIALAGGGAKGFAHLGFLHSIRDQGIPVDLIGGTSAGSIMAGLFAMGYDFPEILRLIKEVWIDSKLTRDYTIPFVSLLNGSRYSKAIKDFFGDRKIETLWIPFLAVACNLTKSEPKIFDQGELWKAIRASTSIPGIFPPFYDEGSLYVDGGLWDNLPGLLLREKGADILISVDLGTGSQPAKDQAYGSLVEGRFPGAAPSAWKLIVNNLLPREQRLDFPHIGEIFMRSMLISSRNSLKKTRESSDIFVELPARDFSTFDWNEYLRLYELGYESSHSKAKEWAKIIQDKIYSK
ncbi:phospholipase, patatin family [Leptospira inadai serovar Lyme str. 10]|uniref:Phospholipase, patatin family n=2 Tax=Leptospira inadai serovar Lyme TaxID=293084 RepID=V6HE62_9LEPT|nr:patatin-like phospholipase family protein [Leptospira inadai]EQA38591.1 phospholipase, patatin family [Leptospira inadai serovar Lyme str. 10]PNV72857.1 cyclic nucleotide-binding protein [Leptospira inadai serovar Lyme]